jgi:hypothetical protein
MRVPTIEIEAPNGETLIINQSDFDPEIHTPAGGSGQREPAKPKPETPKKAKAEPEPAEPEDPEDEDEIDLASLDRADLEEIAREMGIGFNIRTEDETLVTRIKDKQAKG